MTETTQRELQEQIAQLQEQLGKAQAKQEQTAAPEQIGGLAAHEPEPDQVAMSGEPETEPMAQSSSPEVGPQIDPAIAQEVQKYVDIAFTDGTGKAIEQASRTGNDALKDAVHDTLTAMHDELVKRGKIQPAQ